MMILSQYWFRLALPLVAFAIAATPVAARLGDRLASVSTDAAAMRAQVATRSMDGYARHDLTRANGGNVREFTNAAGAVFAVTWSGPGKPDLRSLLGPYFSQLQPAAHGNGRATGRMMPGMRRPMLIDQSDLRIRATGHMGWFHGVAYIPSLVPPGFDLAQLDPVQ